MRRRRATVATSGEWQCKTARSGEWVQHFSNASCFVNVYTIAYRVHVYARASLIHSRNPNPDSSNRILTALALEVMQSPPSVRLSVCQSVFALTLNRVTFGLDLMHVHGL